MIYLWWGQVLHSWHISSLGWWQVKVTHKDGKNLRWMTFVSVLIQRFSDVFSLFFRKKESEKSIFSNKNCMLNIFVHLCLKDQYLIEIMFLYIAYYSLIVYSKFLALWYIKNISWQHAQDKLFDATSTLQKS